MARPYRSFSAEDRVLISELYMENLAAHERQIEIRRQLAALMTELDQQRDIARRTSPTVIADKWDCSPNTIRYLFEPRADQY